MTKIDFINQMNQASNEALNKGSLFNKPVALAQAALECNWGNSNLAQKANNLFSIKAGNTWKGETVWLPGIEWQYKYGWTNSMVEWRKYSNWADCIIDYANIISKFSWYQDALQYLDDANLFLKSILPSGSKPGWATDPDYLYKVLKIAAEIESFGGPKWNDQTID